MALSISPTRTVLWDQVQYAGDPSDFAWVLPVGPGAYIEASSDAWFESLEAVTATHIMSTTLTCNGQLVSQTEQSGGGFGCGGSTVPMAGRDSNTSAGDLMRQGDVEGVTVEHEGTVGPYETVTLSSADPQALRNWLTLNGYDVPPEIDPVIDGYVAEGASFIALRLAPGIGVRQMTPVRVITPGASPILPLRMVAAGTGANTSIVLYVFGEGRYATQNFAEAVIDYGKLSWNWGISSSNYATLRDEALAEDGFLTSFAARQGFTEQVITTDGTAALYDIVSTGESYDNLTDLYFAQSAANENEPNNCGNVSAMLQTSAEVVDTCANGPCEPTPAGALAAKDLECGGFTDVAAAMIGMHPNDVWITRLEANLSRDGLSTDLIIEAAGEQTAEANWHIAPLNENAPCDPNAPPDPAGGTDTQASDDDGGSMCLCTMRPVRANLMVGLTSMVGLLLVARRAARKKR
jgi:hypothetical protein